VTRQSIERQFVERQFIEFDQAKSRLKGTHRMERIVASAYAWRFKCTFQLHSFRDAGTTQGQGKQ